MLEGIHVFKYFKRNRYSNSCEQSQHLVDNQVQVSEPITLDSSSVENICRTSTSDAAIADLGQSISQYIEPVLSRSISRQLSNVKRKAVNLYQRMFESPLNSLTECHTTSFNLMMSSVLQVNSSFYITYWIIIGLILICSIVILLNLYVFLSYLKSDLILKKEIIENYKNKLPLGLKKLCFFLGSSLQNHELTQELNKIRKFLLKLFMFYNFINVIILGSFWYIFEKTI